MNLLLTSEPSIEPLTAANVEESLAYSSGWNSATVAINIKAAREVLETDCDIALITQSWTMKLDKWPKDEVVYLPKGKIQSITSFSYLDTDGNTQTLVADTDYYLDDSSDVARLTPVTNWPSVLTTKKGVITVVWVAGFGDTAADVPGWAKEALLAKITETQTNGQTNTSSIYDFYTKYNKLIFDPTLNQ